MENYFDLPYKEVKNLAHEFYRKISPISCPIFANEKVHFTSDGFNHLVRKGRTPRPKSEQRRRFYLLQFVENIIKDSKLNVIYRQIIEEKQTVDPYDEKISTTSKAEFWTFLYKTDNNTIKVVVRQLGKNGNKHFYSVMANKAFFRTLENKKSPQ